MSFWSGFVKEADRRPGRLSKSSLMPGSKPDYHKDSSDPKEKVRSDIKTYENQKKLRKLYGAGRMASLGLAGIGGFKKNPMLTAAGIGGAFGSGFMRGKSAKEEQAALNRIKRYYDLRDSGKLINLNAVIPGSEKSAAIIDTAEIIGQAAHMIPYLGHYMSQAGSFLSRHTPELISSAAGAVTGTSLGRVAVDVATMPALARKASGGLRSIAHIAAKKSQGVPLTGTEKMWLGASDLLGGWSEKTRAIPENFLAKANASSGFSKGFNKAMYAATKPKIVRYFTNILPDLGSTLFTGKRVGEAAGEALTQVRKISPTHADLGLKAIESTAGQTELLSKVKEDAAALSKAWNSFSNDTMVGRLLKRQGERSGTNLLQRYASNPAQAAKDVEKIKLIEMQAANAGKAIALAAGAGVGGSLLGEYRDRHPLAKNELPTLIAKKRELA